MFYTEDKFIKTTDTTIGTLFHSFGIFNIPNIGEVEIKLIGDEPLPPHFHIIDHNNKIDYCIGIYDGKPVDIIINREYTQGILSNDQLKEIDKWKESIWMHPNPNIRNSYWYHIAQIFDGLVTDADETYSFCSEYIKSHDLKVVIPQYAK